ncbi:tetratricopeptide repeat-containing sensor histidine kinase [Flavihumibacter profundi]|uniref:tetratricopeptide repeat-containing sensor histidine kinase n=1 Tax=Flavihumibacter profundi TaxID=2716883 RepID=UPI001CC7C7F3|nr:histidine kinase dimerization/phosphoacceptor domain -containing protein [Flavihumibacter profundi]MBZ5858414.1 tetratricopeptide repeat protein [Flavihumibacter profundi]
MWRRTIPVNCTLFFLFVTATVHAQIVDFSRNPPYLQVFVETDDFDSSYLTILEKAYRQNLPDSLKFKIGNDLAYYWHTRNLDKANSLTRQVLEAAIASRQTAWEGRLQTTLGAILLRQEKLDSAFAVLDSARTRLPRKDLPQVLTQMGYVMERRGLISKAADYAMEGLRLGESLHDIKAIAMAYSDLSNLFWKQSKFSKGIEYGLKSELLFKHRGIDDMDYSFTLYVIGNNYLAVKDYPRALEYYKRALAISERYQFYNNLADIYISLADLYTITYDYDKAEVNAKNAIRYSTLLDNNFMLMRSWLAMGKLQNLSKRSAEAIKSLDTCLQVATEKFGDNYFLHLAYKELGTAYAATGDYKNAHTAFLKYDQLKDSVFTADADQRVAKLQTEFEVAQKESTIKSQELSILQQKRLQWMILSAAGLLIFSLVVLYRNYQNKQLLNTKLGSLNNDLAQKNAQLDKRNAENELLLKEIHHRVKNNLEVVSGLLALQAAQIDHPTGQEVMKATQNRVLSMGIIHQKLYQGSNLAAIEMQDYFKNLSESIADSFNAGDRINIRCSMQPVELDIDTAIPIGLIANELLTNALKYAFPENRRGEIQISLAKTGAKNEWVFKVADNGIGKPQNSKAKGTGFGTELVNLLVQQLSGKLSTDTSQGTAISIVFKYEMPH